MTAIPQRTNPTIAAIEHGLHGFQPRRLLLSAQHRIVGDLVGDTDNVTKGPHRGSQASWE